jgi:Lon protease-like protein
MEYMPGGLLPLFPLSLVLLPAARLPLHIFEERYKEMMGILIPQRGEFGVVLAKDGGVVSVGCTATVEEVVRRYPDGRLDLMATGRRRFQIVSIDEEKSFIRAQVEFFNDEDATPAPPLLQQRAIAEYAKLRALHDESIPPEPQVGEPQLSFMLGELIDDVDHRQALLVMKSETERLTYLLQALPGYINRRERVELAKRVAPLNGHAKYYNESSEHE